MPIVEGSFAGLLITWLTTSTDKEEHINVFSSLTSFLTSLIGSNRRVFSFRDRFTPYGVSLKIKLASSFIRVNSHIRSVRSRLLLTVN